MESDFACPICKGFLKIDNHSIICGVCNSSWAVNDGIPRFTEDSYYWGEIPVNLMEEVNRRSKTEYWYNVVDELLSADYPNIVEYITDASRADFSYYLPLTKESVVLDVGSGWGTISCLLAERCGRVYALESVKERIDFIKIRADQEQLENVKPIQASFLNMPIPESRYDLVVMNGVLEWIGIADYHQKPDQLQLQVLKSLFKSLKDDGSIYIGIENRLSYSYFLGAHDHSDLPFTSLMPRWAASLTMKINSQKSRRTEQSAGLYRTYTYSYWGYRNLLKSAGFSNISISLVFPDYNNPSYIVPAEKNWSFRYLVKQLYAGSSPKRKAIRFLSSIASPIGLQKVFSPCFAIYAQKVND